MRRFVHLQALLSRLLVLVMLAAALVPALAHAFASDKSAGLGWMEVCTVNGIEARRVAGGEPLPSAPALLVQHCPYCLVSSFDDVLPTVSAPALVPLSGADTVLLPVVSAAASAPTWPDAYPRAPPASR